MDNAVVMSTGGPISVRTDDLVSEDLLFECVSVAWSFAYFDTYLAASALLIVTLILMVWLTSLDCAEWVDVAPNTG